MRGVGFSTDLSRFDVPPHAFHTLTVRFSPTAAAAVEGALTAVAASATSPSSTVVGRACASATPAAESGTSKAPAVSATARRTVLMPKGVTILSAGESTEELCLGAWTNGRCEERPQADRLVVPLRPRQPGARSWPPRLEGSSDAAACAAGPAR